jgi:hypothetical protein
VVLPGKQKRIPFFKNKAEKLLKTRSCGKTKLKTKLPMLLKIKDGKTNPKRSRDFEGTRQATSVLGYRWFENHMTLFEGMAVPPSRPLARCCAPHSHLIHLTNPLVFCSILWPRKI